MTDQAIKKYKIGSYHVTLFVDRLEIVRGIPGLTKGDTILLKNITDVQQGAGNPLTILTSDGKKHRLDVSGKSAEEFQKAIRELI